MRKVLTLLTDLLGMRSSNLLEGNLLSLLVSRAGKKIGKKLPSGLRHFSVALTKISLA